MMIEKIARAMQQASVKDFEQTCIPIIRDEMAKSGRIGQPIPPEFLRAMRPWEELDAADRSTYLIQARAAVAAMMEPSEAMVKAGADVYPRVDCPYEKIHRAMLQAILDEKP